MDNSDVFSSLNFLTFQLQFLHFSLKFEQNRCQIQFSDDETFQIRY